MLSWSSIHMIYFISDTRGIMGKGRRGRLHIDIFFLAYNLHQFVSDMFKSALACRQELGGGGAEEQGKEKTNAPLPKYVWL